MDLSKYVTKDAVYDPWNSSNYFESAYDTPEKNSQSLFLGIYDGTNVQAALSNDAYNIVSLFYRAKYMGNWTQSIGTLDTIKKRALILFDYADSKLPVDVYFSFGGNASGGGLNPTGITISSVFTGDATGDVTGDAMMNQFHSIVDPVYNTYTSKIKNDTSFKQIFDDVKTGLSKIDDLLAKNRFSDANLNIARLYYRWGSRQNEKNVLDGNVEAIPEEWTTWPVPDNYTPDMTENKEAK